MVITIIHNLKPLTVWVIAVRTLGVADSLHYGVADSLHNAFLDPSFYDNGVRRWRRRRRRKDHNDEKETNTKTGPFKRTSCDHMALYCSRNDKKIEILRRRTYVRSPWARKHTRTYIEQWLISIGHEDCDSQPGPSADSLVPHTVL